MTGSGCGEWQRFPARRIEELRNAVLGAELETMQLSVPLLCGSIAFNASRGIMLRCRVIDGKVGLRGVLAEDAATLLLCLPSGSGSRLWLDDVEAGEAVAVMPYCALDAIFTKYTV